ncbi:MAG: DUF7305 domain-containing protein [Bacillota bacterium]
MNIKQEQGAALLLTIFFLALSLAIGVALLTFALRSQETVTGQERETQAYYVARSGADMVAQAIMDKTYEPETGNIETATGNFDSSDLSGYFAERSFEVEIEKKSAKEILLTSTGKVMKKTARISLLLKKPNLFDMAIFTNSDLNVTQPNLELVPLDEIMLGSNGEIYDTDPPKLSEEQKSEFMDMYYPPPELPAYDESNPKTLDSRDLPKGSITIDASDYTDSAYDNDYYDLIYLGSDKYDLIIDTSQGDVTLIVDVLYLKGFLTIRGTGNVTMYVTEEVNIQTPGATIEEDEASFTLIAMDSVTSFDLIANGTFEGHIYAPKVTINMQSNFTKFEGSMIADTLEGAADKPIGEIRYKEPPDDIYERFDFIKFYRDLWMD